MKILHLIHAHTSEMSGGAQHYLRDLMCAQRAAGLEVGLATGSMQIRSEPGAESFDADGVSAHRLHRDDHFIDHFAQAFHPGIEALVRDLLKHERPDLVHLHHWVMLTSNIVEIAASLGIPTVCTLHDLHASCPRCFRINRDGAPCLEPIGVESCFECAPRYGHETKFQLATSIEFFRDEMRAELELARDVIVSTAGTADLFAATTGIDRARFTVLPLAYRRIFTEASPPDWPVDRDSFRFGFWGTIGRYKGAVDLVQAWIDLEDRGLARPAELHLFGGFENPDVESEIRELAQGHGIFLRGEILPEELGTQGLHMGVFPSRCIETHGIVLDECFELGLPCIVSEVGALAERAGAAARRVPAGDVQALAAAMGEILADGGLWRSLQGAVPLVSSPSPEEHSARLLEIYEGAIGSNMEPQTPDAARVLRRMEQLIVQREGAQRALHDHGPS